MEKEDGGRARDNRLENRRKEVGGGRDMKRTEDTGEKGGEMER